MVEDLVIAGRAGTPASVATVPRGGCPKRSRERYSVSRWNISGSAYFSANRAWNSSSDSGIFRFAVEVPLLDFAISSARRA